MMEQKTGDLISGILVALTTTMTLIPANTTSIGGLGIVVSAGNGFVALWGWWVLLFGGREGGRSGKKRSRMPERLKKL